MEAHYRHVLTLANSIIGVSILAMPYCFKQCGVLPAVIVLLLSNLISRLSCHFLIKSAIIARRRTFEYLAFYIFGGIGKFCIEVGMIGFLIGTCIAFFVVIGDLGPEIISEVTGQVTTSTMRTGILLALTLFCVLPLGLLKNIDSLAGVFKATVGFYFFLVLKIVIDAVPQLLYGNWSSSVIFWRPAGVIQCLPIFSMALSCQTQLFEIFQIVNNPSLEKMNQVIKNAVNICTLVYFFVGFFGYIAFADKNFTGNILLSFTPSLLTNVIKLGFILSVAFSFPLVIFPCRASVYSLIYKPGLSSHEIVSNYIPEGKFKGLTLVIVFVSLIIGILIPNIEFVLGLVGSSIGIMICVLFPVLSFIYISQKDTNERLLAKVILIIGFILMVLGTLENLHHLGQSRSSPIVGNVVDTMKDVTVSKLVVKHQDIGIKNTPIIPLVDKSFNQSNVEEVKEIIASKEIRHEPPQPMEPQESQPEKKDESVAIQHQKERDISLNVDEKFHAKELSNKNKDDNVDVEAIKKDDKETLLQQKDDHAEEHKILIDKIQKQNEVQEELVKQQKKLIEVFEKQQEQKVNDEKLKAEIEAVKEIESIALKAIEKISGDTKQNEKIVAELEKNVLQKVNEKDTDKNVISKPQEDTKLEELKQMNSLLSAKIKHNNITQKPDLAIYIKENESKDFNVHEDNKINNVSKIAAPNESSPLLLNLGQQEAARNTSKVLQKLPLPLAVSYLQQKTANVSNNSIITNSSKANLSENRDLNKDASVEDAKILRRDILAYVTSKRRR